MSLKSGWILQGWTVPQIERDLIVGTTIISIIQKSKLIIFIYQAFSGIFIQPGHKIPAMSASKAL
jgi:hypothetical protein